MNIETFPGHTDSIVVPGEFAAVVYEHTSLCLTLEEVRHFLWDIDFAEDAFPSCVLRAVCADAYVDHDPWVAADGGDDLLRVYVALEGVHIVVHLVIVPFLVDMDPTPIGISCFQVFPFARVFHLVFVLRHRVVGLGDLFVFFD